MNNTFKMGKSVLGVIILITIMLIVAPKVYAAEEMASGTCGIDGDNVTWSLNSDGVLTISGSGAMGQYGIGYSPWYDHADSVEKIVIEDGITRIETFNDCKNLQEVEMADSVISIGPYCFGYYGSENSSTKLRSVQFSTNLSTIGDYAFAYCESLENITLPDSVETIGSNSFYYCNNLRINGFPSKLKTVGDSAFAGCKSIKYIELPNGVKWGLTVLANCEGLEKVTLPNDMTTIPEGLLSGCSSLNSLDIPFGVKIIGKSALAGTGLKSISLPNSVVEIKEGAFSSNIESIRLNPGLKLIGDYAFQNCYYLKSLTIPDGVTKIGYGAFFGDYHLKRINFPDSISEMGEYVLNPDYTSVPASRTCYAEAYVVKGSYAHQYFKTHQNWGVYFLYSSDQESNTDNYIYSRTESINLTEGDLVSLKDFLNCGDSVYFPLYNVHVLDESIAMYDANNGQIAALSKGGTSISITNNDEETVIPVIVSDNSVSAESMRLPFEEIDIKSGERVNLQVSFEPNNATDKEFEWKSSNNKVATVSDGVVRGVGTGTATITATCGALSSVCTVRVTTPLEAIVSLEEKEIEKGESRALSYYVVPYISDDNSDVSFKSDNPDVVKVDDDGLITANKVGDATITISKGNKKAEVELSVLSHMTGIVLDTKQERLEKGNTKQLTVSYEPEDTTDYKGVWWMSSNDAVASVDDNGLVTSTGKGIATITATSITGNFTATCTIISPSIPLQNIELPADIEIGYGSNDSLPISFIPDNTTDDKSVIWSSSDESIASFDENGQIITNDIGSTTITAKVGDYSASAKLTVVKGVPNFTLPEGLRANCGDKLSSISLPNGFTWAEPDSSVGNKGTNIASVIYTPEDTDHYISVPGLIVGIDVDHSFTEKWVSNNNEHWHQCACGEKDSVSAHEWNKVYSIDKVATHTEDGSRSIHCHICDAIKEGTEETIPKNGSDYNPFDFDDLDMSCADKGLFNGVPWWITEDGILVIGEDQQEYELDGSGSATWKQSGQNINEIIIRGRVKVSGSASGLFSYMSCQSMDLTGLDVSNVTSMNRMFSGCGNLKEIDLSGFDTRNVQSMQWMFANCSNLKSIDVSHFNTASTTNYSYMFEDCTGLESIDLFSFHDYYFSDYTAMFNNCSKLSTLDLSDFKGSAYCGSMLAGTNSLRELNLGNKMMGCSYVGLPDYHWKRNEDDNYYSGSELFTNYDCSSMSGIYRPYYIVNYDSNGHGEDIGNQLVSVGSAVQKPENPVANGYVFRGWFLTKGGNTPFVFEDTLNGDVTLYAKWNELCVEHSWSEETTEATCSENGRIDRTCNVCGYTVSEIIPSTGHKWNEEYTVDKEASCTEEGSKSIHCSKCDEVTEVTPIPALGHEWDGGSITTEPTCTETGVKTFICKRCEETRTEAVEATGHSFSDEYTTDTEPTCTTEGSKSKHCTKCDAVTEVTAIPAKGHTFGPWEVVTPSTCEGAGSHQHSCEVCGFTEAETTDPTGHDIEENYTIDVPATCTTDGSQSKHCKNCEVTFDSEVIPATGHNYGGWITTLEPTCKEEGSKEQVCSACGDKVTENIPALGHAWNEESTIDKAATCTEAGSKSIHCARCNETKNQEVIPALGHNWNSEPTVEKVATCTEDGAESIHCSRCDAVKDGSEKAIPKTGHMFGTWKTTKAATEIAAGEKTRTCSVCGHAEKHTIAELAPTLPAVKISKPAAAKKAATIKWKKLSKKNLKKIKKIEIQYSLDNNFKTGVVTKYAKAKKTSLKIKRLQSKKKYYVRIRAYTSAGGAIHVSKWSKTKPVKVK